MNHPAETTTPSLYDWAGGAEALTRLTTIFYAKVAADPLLAPVFARMGEDHPRHVAAFVGEVFGGPKAYSGQHGEPGGHAEMVSHHVGRRLTEEQRRRWVSLICDAADEAGLPDDPEFRSAFVAYLEWGTRLAVINSAPETKPDPAAAMPRWGWGEPGGPYRPEM